MDPLFASPTCQGQSPGNALCPPTILSGSNIEWANEFPLVPHIASFMVFPVDRFVSRVLPVSLGLLGVAVPGAEIRLLSLME